MRQFSKYAPYLYINKESENKYLVFVTIPHYPGQHVEVAKNEKSPYQNGMTLLQYNIVGPEPPLETDNIECYHHVTTLEPITHYKDNFDPSKYGIKVKTYCLACNEDTPPAHLIHSIVSYYEDADQQNELEVSKDIALNSPYLYLKNPSAHLEEQNNVFEPKCLLFTSGTIFNKSVCKNGNGSLIQTIDLTTNGLEKEVSMVPLKSLLANQAKYNDKSPIDGYFETEIIEYYSSSGSKKKKKKRKKGRLRNSSADSNPLVFIDDHTPFIS